MDSQTRHDLFESGDRTALVCVDDLEIQRTVVEHLMALNYKIHTGLFSEDISLKLKSHNYDIVVIYESFNDSVLEGNAALAEVTRIPANQRRNQYVVLLGPNMVTNDAMQAFEHSADLTFSISDLTNFGQVLGRGVAQHQNFYQRFLECVRVAGA